MANFEIRTEWEDAPGVTVPELAATWARIEIRAGNRAVTQFLSQPGRTVRPGVFGSAFPLAKWIVRWWWNILEERLPSPEILRGGRKTSPNHWSWLQRHNVIFAREGMPYPDLSIYREDELVGVHWVPDPEDIGASGRFVSTGFMQLERSHAAEVFSDFVERVLERVEGISSLESDQLREDWEAVESSSADQQERELCWRLAALGLDPYSADSSSWEKVLANEKLSPSLLRDLLASSSPDSFEQDRASVQKLLKHLPEPSVSALIVAPVDPRPYRTGYARTHALRKHIGLRADEPVRDMQKVLEQALGVNLAEYREPSIKNDRIEAVVQSNGFAFAGTPPSREERFLLGRALHHGVFVTGGAGQRRLLTQGNDWQQAASRAFAAELLAPAEALRRRLKGAGWAAQEQMADEFDVSPMLIAHQVNNHNLGSV